MLLVLFTLEDFIRVRRLSRARESSPPRTERGRHNAGAIRHSVGQKVAGGTSLWKYCNPDTWPMAVLACRRRYVDRLRRNFRARRRGPGKSASLGPNIVG